ncbi:MAG: hypothetical protein ACK4FE_09240 [Azonexus sp.]
MRKFLAIAATVLTTGFSSAAHAQFATIDIANLVQSIMTVMSEYQQEAQQVEQLMNQAQQLEYDYRQLQSLGQGDVSGLLGTVRSALNTQRAYVGSVKGLYGDLGNAKRVAEDLYRRMAASGLSQAEWMEREAEINKARQEGNGYLSDYQADVLQQVGKRYEEVRNLQGKITSTEGTHESMQLMNSQMNVLLATTNQLLEHNATLAQRATHQDIEQAGREKSRVDAYGEWRKAQTESTANARKAFRALEKNAPK